MRTIVIFCSFFIFSASPNPNGRTINLAIETSLQFEPKDLHSGIDLVSGLKTFIDKLYRSLGHEHHPVSQYHMRAEAEPEPQTHNKDNTNALTNFIIYLGNNLLNTTGADLHNISKILKTHLKNYKKNHNETFYDLFLNPEIRKSAGKAMKRWSNVQMSSITDKLKSFLTFNNSQLQNFARKLNSFYTEHDVTKVMDLTKKLDKYLRKKKDANSIIKKILDFVIFDKYNNMNMTSRRSVVENIKMLTDYVSRYGAPSEEDHHSHEFEDVSGSEGEEVHKHHRHKKNKKKSISANAVHESLLSASPDNTQVELY